MKKRLARKQIKKLLGYDRNGSPVYNCVSNPSYTGGTSIGEEEEDCYKSEVRYIRKRHGAPLLLRNRYATLYNRIHGKEASHE